MDSGSGTTHGTESALRAAPDGYVSRDHGLVCEACAGWVPEDDTLAQVHTAWHERVGR